MNENLTVDVIAEPTSTLVVVVGELDADNCSRLGDAVGADAGSTVILDLGELQFIDSSGVSEVLRLHSRLNDDGGSLVIRSVSAPVRKVLEITGLLEILGVD